MGSFINALKGWMGGQDWSTTNLQTRLGSNDWSNPIASVRVPYNRGDWLADLGSLKEKGQGDHKQLKSHWNSRLKGPVSLGGRRLKGPGPCWWPTTDCSADSD